VTPRSAATRIDAWTFAQVWLQTTRGRRSPCVDIIPGDARSRTAHALRALAMARHSSHQWMLHMSEIPLPPEPKKCSRSTPVAGHGRDHLGHHPAAHRLLCRRLVWRTATPASEWWTRRWCRSGRCSWKVLGSSHRRRVDGDPDGGRHARSGRARLSAFNMRLYSDGPLRFSSPITCSSPCSPRPARGRGSDSWAMLRRSWPTGSS
jgi:hypothetical protein